MAPRAFTDEQLMAFADGEAAADTGMAISDAMRTDPALAARIALFTASGSIARQSFGLEPVPMALEEKIRAMAGNSAVARAPVLETSAQTGRHAANSNRPSWRLPLAASVALAVGLAGGYLMSARQPAGSSGIEVAGLVDAAIDTALRTVPAGGKQQIGEDQFTAIASFKNAGGQLCREFERDFKSGAFVVGVACLESGGWRTQAVVASARSDGGYAPASSMDAIEAYIGAIGAGPVMNQAKEAAELAKTR